MSNCCVNDDIDGDGDHDDHLDEDHDHDHEDHVDEDGDHDHDDHGGGEEDIECGMDD